MANNIKVSLKGDKELATYLKRLGSKAPQFAGAALKEEAESIMADSKSNYVPVDLGALKTSGHVKAPQFLGRIIKVTMGYGGAAMAYALIVHENLRAFHAHGQAKYLEAPVLKAASGMGRRLAGRLKGLFR